MKKDLNLNIQPLGFMWEVRDPFIFCAHHLDYYPKGNQRMEPDASLFGRSIGNDFTPKDGWRMYHGEYIPGFPAHPHRGFETITIVETGFVDHSDSWGQAGRYGQGDVQWMTAGSGLQHSEMFPLLNSEDQNPLELFQVWLNLPAKDKFAKPFYKMLWNHEIPVHHLKDAEGKTCSVKLVAGSYDGIRAPDPAPDSWAADPVNEVAIWIIRLEAGAQWSVPPAPEGTGRTFYFYRGSSIRLEGQEIKAGNSFDMTADTELSIENGSDEALIVMLQGKPIAEPVAQYGPFVMNNAQEIRQAMLDFQTTSFGGWPWPRHDHVHPREKGRFARYLGSETDVFPEQ